MQRIYLQAMVMDAKQTDHFQKAISDAIRATHIFLNVRIYTHLIEETQKGRAVDCTSFLH